MKNKIYLIALLVGVALGLGSCNDFLDETPNKTGSAYVYHMDQLYGMMGSVDLYFSSVTDANSAVASGMANSYMAESFLMSDAVEITPDYYDHGGIFQEPVSQYSLYSWDKNELKNGANMLKQTWTPAWDRIYRFNTVLENLDKVIQTTEAIRNQVEGEARFGRAYYHFLLLTQYCQWKEDAPGIGYREDTDPGMIPARQTVGYTLKRIYEDLQLAQEALTKAGRVQFEFERNTRPTVPTVQAFRARVDLYRGNYASALLNADAALKVHGELVDLRTDVEHQATDYPWFDLFLLDENGEVAEQKKAKYPEMLQAAAGRAMIGYRELYLPSWSGFTSYGWYTPISDSFYNLWTDKENDARWIYYYNSFFSIAMLGECATGDVPYDCQQWLREADYHAYGRFGAGGGLGQILGMSTAEMYLTKAECMARTGASATEVAEVLKTLRRTRFLTDEAADAVGGTLQDVLDERYREMGAFWRFFDIKRLNGAENASIEIRRKVMTNFTDPNSVAELVIPANDPRWALPIYETECIQMGWEQNEGWK